MSQKKLPDSSPGMFELPSFSHSLTLNIMKQGGHSQLLVVLEPGRGRLAETTAGTHLIQGLKPHVAPHFVSRFLLLCLCLKFLFLCFFFPSNFGSQISQRGLHFSNIPFFSFHFCPLLCFPCPHTAQQPSSFQELPPSCLQHSICEVKYCRLVSKASHLLSESPTVLHWHQSVSNCT